VTPAGVPFAASDVRQEMPMNEPKRPEDAPGHYGAGYSEQVPEGAAPRAAPITDADEPLVRDVDLSESLLDADATVVIETVVVAETPLAVDAPVESGSTRAGDDGEPVVFTPDDVTLPPPDRPPTEGAPESEKVELIFERS
jgi:hypothetical protein